MEKSHNGDELFHSLQASKTENIEKFYDSYDIILKFQEIGMLFDKCIDIIDGPLGMLKTSKQTKLGDKMAGNTDIIDLDAFLKVLKEIHSYIYQGIKYVSRLNELQRIINKMIKHKIWDTKLDKLPPDLIDFSTILLKNVNRYSAVYSTGALVGGATAILTVGAALGCLFGLTIACLTSICCLFSGVIALTAVGVGVGTGIGLLGVWFYNAVKIGQKRSESFLAFRDLQKHIDETNFRFELRNLVFTLKNHCEGILGVAGFGSSKLNAISPNTTIGSIRSNMTEVSDVINERLMNISLDDNHDMIRITEPVGKVHTPIEIRTTAKPSLRMREDAILFEYNEFYKTKMTEFELNKPDLSKEIHKLIATALVEDKCKERLSKEGFSNEIIQDFINHKLMPKINLT